MNAYRTILLSDIELKKLLMSLRLDGVAKRRSKHRLAIILWFVHTT